MPLNPDKRLGGNIELDDRGVAHVVKPDAAVYRYTSHHSTCPDANAHRKPRAR